MQVGRWTDRKPADCGAALEGRDAALALLFIVAPPLPLVDKSLTAGEHEIHPPRQLVRRGGVHIDQKRLHRLSDFFLLLIGVKLICSAL